MKVRQARRQHSDRCVLPQAPCNATLASPPDLQWMDNIWAVITFSKIRGKLSWVEQGLTSHQTHYRSYRGRVFTGQMTQPTVSKHWRRKIIRTVLCCIVYHNCVIWLRLEVSHMDWSMFFYLHQGRHISLVCYQLHVISTDRTSWKFYQMYPWKMKNQVNFGNHSHLDPDTGFLKRILWHCQTGLFSKIWLISQEVSIKFGSHSSGCEVWIQTTDPDRICLSGSLLFLTRVSLY